MNKFIYGTLFILITGKLFSYDAYVELIKEDIRSLHLNKVGDHLKQFASQLERKGMQSSKRKALYKELYETALLRKQELMKMRGIFKNQKDFVTCIGGLLLMTSVVTVPVIGLLTMDSQGSREENTRCLGKYGMFGLALSCIGGKLTWDGIQGKVQQEKLVTIQAIEKLISEKASF